MCACVGGGGGGGGEGGGGVGGGGEEGKVTQTASTRTAVSEEKAELNYRKRTWKFLPLHYHAADVIRTPYRWAQPALTVCGGKRLGFPRSATS